MALRFYTYFLVVRHKSGWALTRATFGWASGVLSTILYCLSLYYPIITASWIIRIIQDLAGLWALTFMKIAITIYILHLQDRIYKIGRWVLLVTMVLNVLSIIVLIPLYFVQCGPSMDTSLIQYQKCGQQGKFRSIWYGVWAAVTDLLLLIYPVIIMWNRRICRKQKILICILLSLGTIGTVVSVVNLIIFTRFKPHVEIAVILNIIEIWTVLIASAGAPLWPLFKKWDQQLKRKKSNTAVTMARDAL